MSRLLVTEDAVRRAVVAEALKDLGYQGPVGGWNKWGAWYGPGWQNAYFCAAGWSYCWNMAVGEADAREVIGYQTHGGVAPHRRGYIWTVAMMVQHRSKKVALRNLKPGDALMSKYSTGDNRAGNEVNHVDLVERNYPNQGYLIAIGYNVPKPGATTGDPSRGGGVWRRRVYYNDRWIVAGLRMPAAALAERNRKAWVKVQQHLTDLGLGDFQMTGVPGPATKREVLNYSKIYGYSGAQDNPFVLLPHMEASMSNLLEAVSALSRKMDDQNRRIEQVRSEQENQYRSLLDRTSKKWLGESVWSYKFYGFVAHWWLRLGLILDPNHRHFPADPGSPADKELRAEAAFNEDGTVQIYLPEGQTSLRVDPDTNEFVLVEDS